MIYVDVFLIGQQNKFRFHLCLRSRAAALTNGRPLPPRPPPRPKGPPHPKQIKPNKPYWPQKASKKPVPKASKRFVPPPPARRKRVKVEGRSRGGRGTRRRGRRLSVGSLALGFSTVAIGTLLAL